MNQEVMLYEKKVCIGDDRLLSVEKRIFKDFTIPVHLHDYYEIEIIVSGVGVSEFDGVSYNLCPGMAFFITPNDFHNFNFNGKTVLYNLSFYENILPDSFLFSLSRRKIKNVSVLSGDELNAFLALCNLLEECGEIGLESKISILNSIMSIFPKFNMPNRLPLSGNEYADKAEMYIKIHFRDDITVKSVADYCGLSIDHLTRVFTYEKGITPTDYIRHRRIKYAKKLLETTDLPIIEIALGCGFQSLSTFNRVFKSEYGEAPSLYRKGRLEK